MVFLSFGKAKKASGVKAKKASGEKGKRRKRQAAKKVAAEEMVEGFAHSSLCRPSFLAARLFLLPEWLERQATLVNVVYDL